MSDLDMERMMLSDDGGGVWEETESDSEWPLEFVVVTPNESLGEWGDSNAIR